jgi:hypothetical protein
MLHPVKNVNLAASWVDSLTTEDMVNIFKTVVHPCSTIGDNVLNYFYDQQGNSEYGSDGVRRFGKRC